LEKVGITKQLLNALLYTTEYYKRLL